MRLADERKVIEVLLCGSTWFNQIGLTAAAARLGLRPALTRKAERLRESVRDEDEHFDLSYSHTTCEAAYRLIESSPRLIREWFGKRGTP